MRCCFSAAEPGEDWEQASAREFAQGAAAKKVWPPITIPPARQAKLNFSKLQLCKRNVLRLDMSAVISNENFSFTNHHFETRAIVHEVFSMNFSFV